MYGHVLHRADEAIHENENALFNVNNMGKHVEYGVNNNKCGTNHYI